MNNNIPVDKVIGIPTPLGLTFIRIDEILFCKALGNYSEINLTPGNRIEIVTRTLKEFEKILEPNNFFRIHRSYLINLRRIQAYHRTQHNSKPEGNGGCIIMENEMKLPVARQKRRSLLNLFSQPF